MNNSTEPTVIVGGGFVGLFTALYLSHDRYPEPIILIDSTERFVFKPLLYEYLSGEMYDKQVLPQYKELLKGTKVAFVQGKVTGIDLEQRQVELASGLSYNYRYLVLGVGSSQGYFGTEGAEENAFPFRTGADTVKLERHIRQCLQRASQTESQAERSKLLTFAVVGAGHSGIETAATLADLLPHWYTSLGGDIEDIRIVLMDFVTEILAKDDINLRETAQEALKNRTVPVELLLGAKVAAVDSDSVQYQLVNRDETETLSTKTAIWTAGIANNPLIESLTQIKDESKNEHGSPLVRSTLQLVDFPEVFAAGDCATVKDHALPPVAQIAYQQAKGIADNLIALSKNKETHSVDANMRGTLIKLGLNEAVANLFDKIQVKGRAGNLIRNQTYLEMLPTPLHNFKASTEWLTDEIFNRHHHSSK
ncbi:MAG: NAD(P)/FAD-dependent oxidoreductase [Pleurocapsa minor HA4230-MV1]|jgi:NADH dehydrogenase|nr:NAD(P)/FAD-dependent oxidoreductase [Pleurocapsa minor HA4230-MV1]